MQLMQRFVAPAPASSSAAQPAGLDADEHDMVAGSAAQPTSRFRSMADVQRWLTTECVFADTPEVQRLRQAVDILTCPQPRQEDIRVLQKPCHWNVTQQIARKPRPLPDVIDDLKRKVFKAACKLQMHTERSSRASGSVEQPDHPLLANRTERHRKRMTESTTQEQRPAAKARVLAAAAAISSAAQPAGLDADEHHMGAASAAQPVVAHSMQKACSVTDSVASTEGTNKQPQAEHRQSATLPQIVTLNDCKAWCDSLPEAPPPVKYLSAAIAVLQGPNSRERRAHLHSLCKHWAVEQYHAQNKYKQSKIAAALEENILKEAQRLAKLLAQHGTSSSLAVAMQNA
jgi:hypothetical protein